MAHRVEMWRTLRRVITVAGVTGALYLLVLLPLERGVSGTKASVERGLEAVLAALTHSGTRVVEGRAEIVETAEIQELSLLEMRLSATRTFEKENYVLKYLPLGTKKMIVRGEYQVKGGYRLTPGTSLRLEGGTPVARFPKPQVLSVELIDFEILNEENGWFNKVQPEDRARVLRELRAQMRKEAEQSGMLDTVERSLAHRLRELLGTNAVQVEVQQEIP